MKLASIALLIAFAPAALAQVDPTLGSRLVQTFSDAQESRARIEASRAQTELLRAQAQLLNQRAAMEASAGRAQPSGAPVDVFRQTMTADEYYLTGMHKLTPAERHRLGMWLARELRSAGVIQ